jgi:hypothetical protein
VFDELKKGGISLTLPQRCIYRRNGRGTKSSGRA